MRWGALMARHRRKVIVGWLVLLVACAAALPFLNAVGARGGGRGGGDVRAWLTGYSPITNDETAVEGADTERAEAIDPPVALIILVLALGALVAALLPLLPAISALLLTFGVIFALTFGLTFDAFFLSVVTMIGTGIGIDYALFIVSRFREELARRGVFRDGGASRGGASTGGVDRAVADAAGAAVSTSGRTVMFSGVIVAISICSLFIVDSPVFHEIALGVLVSVICTLAVALTLLPAVLAALGPRVNAGSLPARMRPADILPDTAAAGGTWARWAHTVMRRPLLFAVSASVVLIIVAVPVAGLKYGIDLGTSSLKDRPTAAAQRVLTRSFSPGAVSPVQVTVTGPGDTPLDAGGLARAGRLTEAISRDPRVAAAQTTPGDGRLLINAVPSVPIDSRTAIALVRHIRTDLAPAARGSTCGPAAPPRSSPTSPPRRPPSSPTCWPSSSACRCCSS